VPLDEPAWWYADTATPTARLLSPLAWAYGRIAAARMNQPPCYRSRLPVICIGNLTAGGTGKTPLTRAVATLLGEAGHAPVILSRGYGGRHHGPRIVDATTDDAADVGDEPLLLAATAPVCIARDRAAGARMIEKEMRADVILMDDGLQNPTLAKNLSIAVIDGNRWFGNRRTIPSGPLRAPLAVQLPLIDAIVINQGGAPPNRAYDVSVDTNVQALHRICVRPILQSCVSPATELSWLIGTPVVAYAGIANPKRFFDLLVAHGADVRATVSFRDHQTLTQRDAHELRALAEHHVATLITTEKDLVRLPRAGSSDALAQLKAASRTLRVEMRFQEQDEARLRTLLLAALESRPAA
jgi:tetraacyldisaccharide 4'-kinase